ncbi:MAG: alpha/beta hydrolase [Pirellulaceae bacterium]|nr:alpha/beta hydrolase [Pirellulaceae bacterium]
MIGISCDRIARRLLSPGRLVLGAMLIILSSPSQLAAEERVRLKNGISESGTIFNLPGLNQNPFASAGGGVKAQPIIMVDDGMRRVYMHRRGMVIGEPQATRGIERTIEFDFKAPLSGKAIAGLGPLLAVSPFNEFARRAVNIRGVSGETLTILQGITELNSRYAKVEALKDKPSYMWDMRVPTSSLDSETLQAIFERRLKRPNLTDEQRLDLRLEHVRFFIEAERFGDARDVLLQTMDEFPDQANMEKRLIGITELEASKIIQEAQHRAEVGQEPFARRILSSFRPESVGRITRLEVQDAVAKLDQTQKSVDDAMAKMRRLVGKLNPGQITSLTPLLNEMDAGLSAATLPRLSGFILGDETKLTTDNHVALGVSGWLMGTGASVQNLSVAISMIHVRDLVAEYLATDDAARRAAIIQELANVEGAEPEYIARMLPLLKPPRALTPETENPEIPGMHAIGVDESPDTPRAVPRYVVQLPPDYDPLREYPCIVSLHPPQATPQQQLEWWAGPYNAELGFRGGHATRHGYIVVSPAWTRASQRVYEYTPREHQRVLVALRDAMRRTSINADRVFLVGHGEGATAAWDIAVSHPEYWAGMIAISSDPDKTITHYSPNAVQLPMYLVVGELDRIRSKDNHAFSAILDDYVNVRADAMVVIYRGWGHAYFFDEIHRLFDWMNAASHRRKDIPQTIDHVTMRDGDDFFWWLELDGLKPGTAINPILWEQAKRIRAKKVEASIGANNQIRISQGPSERFTVWMRPGMGIDLNQPITIRYGSRPIYHDYDGSITTMLEDVRQRADRKRPFWTKKVVP